jgi:hypothetical protein
MPRDESQGPYTLAFVYPRIGENRLYKGPLRTIADFISQDFSNEEDAAWIEYVEYFKNGPINKEWFLMGGENVLTSGLSFQPPQTGHPDRHFMFVNGQYVAGFRRMPRKWIRELDEFIDPKFLISQSANFTPHTFEYEKEKEKEEKEEYGIEVIKGGNRTVVLIDEWLRMNHHCPGISNAKELYAALTKARTYDKFDKLLRESNMGASTVDGLFKELGRLKAYDIKAEQEERQRKLKEGMELVPSQEDMKLMDELM